MLSAAMRLSVSNFQLLAPNQTLAHEDHDQARYEDDHVPDHTRLQAQIPNGCIETQIRQVPGAVGLVECVELLRSSLA